jgi:hypothetical protein
MVSRIPYPHVVNQAFRGQRGMGHIVGLLFALAAIMSIKGYSVPIICTTFVLWPPILFLWRRFRSPKRQVDPIF